MLIHQSFDQMCVKQPEKVCLIYGSRRVTYREAGRQAGFLAKRLAAQLAPGDKVLLNLSNPVEQLLYFYAIVKAGGACVFTNETDAARCAGLMERHGLRHCIRDGFQPEDEAAPALPEMNSQAVFLGALSSGSTGIPKLIWRDHRSWTGAFTAQSRVFGLSSTDILYLAGNLSYTANLNACLHLLAEGGTVVIAGNHLPRTWVREMAQHRVSAVFMVPPYYRTLLRAMKGPVASVRSVVTAGAKIDAGTVRDLVRYFPCAKICEYYGASELGHVSYATAEDLLAYPGSVGRVFPGVSITIEEGIIWVKSPYLAPAYRPRATVGDLGELDKNGYLTLLGRQQGLINAGGIKVIPEQLEAVLRQCPGIAEVVVAGIGDEIRGERIGAWIVRSDRHLQAGDIRKFCRNRINQHFWPQKVFFLNELPVLPNGKIDRRRLQEGLAPASFPGQLREGLHDRD